MLITNIFPVLVEALLNPKISHDDKKQCFLPIDFNQKTVFQYLHQIL